MKNEPLKEHLSELSHTVSHMVSNPLRPLSAFRSIKMKIGILVLGAVTTTVFVYWLGLRFGHAWPSISGVVAAIVALVLTRFFAQGLTTPLREMADISKEIAQGNYDVEVNINSQDEIGSLAITFNKMVKELRQTENLRRELIANASHELKTPLTALQAQLENLVDGVETPDESKMQILLAQTEHLSALVKDLLDLSKLESGISALDLTAFSIVSILENVKQLISQTNKEAEITINASEEIIEADYHRLLQVFTNIITNSINHSGAKCKILCIVKGLDKAIEIDIDDNGPGIDEDKKDLVFERFYRADQSRNSKDGGSGIGLAIAKQIINMHDGTISILNSQMGGTRVRIVLPKKQLPQNLAESIDMPQLSSHTNSNIKKSIQSNNINPPKEKTKWNSIQSTT